MRVFLPKDRVRLSARGMGTFHEWPTTTRGTVTEVRNSQVRVLVDGTRVPCWFPKSFWDRDDAVRQEERAPADGWKGTPDGTPTPVETAPAVARAPEPPLRVICLTCLTQTDLELRDGRAPGPFVMPKCCGAWMQLLPLTRVRLVPLMRSARP